MRTSAIAIVLGVIAALQLGCHASQSVHAAAESHGAHPTVVGVWCLVELHDWSSDGEDVSTLGVNAPGMFVYTPDGRLSLHIMTEHERDLVSGDTSDADLGRIYRPYIGYFGTYEVDYERMTITHHIEGAKLPNRLGRAAVRTFYFKDSDLVLDFTSPDGRRYYRRLQRVESLQ